MELVRLLKERESAALFVAGGYSRELPIHALFKSTVCCPPLQVVQFIMDQAPGTLDFPASHGEIPLHVACRNKHISLKVMQLFVLMRPDLLDLRLRNQFGNMALHKICISPDAPLEIMSYLAQQYPEAVQDQTNFGILPVQLTKSVEAVRFLI